MTRSRTIISVVASLVLGTLTAAPAFGALTASPNPSSTGSYTVSDASPPTLPADVSNAYYDIYYYYNLEETAPGGGVRDFDLGRGPVSQGISGKSPGTYTYRLQTCVFTYQEDEFEASETTECTDRGSSLSVSVVAPDTAPDFGAASVSDKSWTQNAAITAFTVPAATGGNAPLSYTASGLPAGVSMSAFRWVSGTPTAHGSGTATVTVTDDDGDTDTLQFDWTVAEDLVPDFGTASVSYKSWVQNSAITAFTVPAAGGGDGTLSYSISGLPGGLSMSASRQVSGTPTSSGVGNATVTVTDADGDTDTLSFGWSVGVDRMPSYGDASIADQTWKQNAAIRTVYAPIPSSGNYPLTYSATGLPAGVSISGTRAISGTPTTAGTGTATVTVTDNDGDTDSIEFDWTVEEDLMPSFGSASIADQTWTLRSTITAVSVPAASGGDGTLRYSASGLPTGLYLTFSTRRIQGIPTGSDADSGTATVTVRDADGDTDTLTFDWTVEDPMPSFGDATVSDQTWTEDSAISTLYLPGATGGNTPLRYAATGLPDGLSMSILRRVTGTPATAGSGTATLTVTDSDGDADTLQFGWTVEPPPPPEGPTFPTPVAARTWKQHSAIAAFTVPAATGGTGTLTYTATGLPADVTMSSSRRVSGTPSASGSGTATVTVTDGNELTATLEFAWTVEADLMPDFGTATVSDKTWTQNTEITAFTVPSAMGGDTPLSYSIDGLPSEVNMSSARAVSGTPAATGMGTATVTVTDDDGDTDTLQFDWTVQAPPDPMPTFGTATVSAKRWKENRTIAAFTVPAATDGDAPLSYTADGLPGGVTMSTSRRVSGAPTGPGSGTATVTVEDDDGDTATLTFAWTVDEDLTPSFGTVSVSDKSWTRGQAIAAFTVDEATGGDGTLSYTARGLPAGVTMSSARVVSGMPSAVGSGTATVTVRDEDGDIDTVSFAWTVTEPVVPPGQLSASPNPSATGNYTVSHPSPPALPTDVSTGTYETVNYYNLEEIVPGGEARYFSFGRGPVSLDFTGKATGTYRYRLQTCVYTLQQTALDIIESDECTNSGSALSVTVDRVPTLPPTPVPDKTWIQNQPITAFTVPAASGGDAPLTYSATGLPSGVSMSSTRRVSGTPTAAGSGTATVTVTDDDGDTDTAQFAWTVEADTEPAFALDSLDARTWIDDIAIETFTVDAATGGNAPLSYSATSLPAGVTLSADREVSGTPTAPGTGTATVTVTDRDGDTDSLTVAWTVEADTVPTFGASTSVPARNWTANTEIAALTVPAAMGGNAPLSYTAADLPEGVTMSADREVSGTPINAGAGTATIIVTDRDGDTDTLSFDWTVEDGDPMPEFPANPVNPMGPYAWIQGTAITAFTVDAATGGDAPLSYAATALPDGVTMSAGRVVSGTPTATGSGTATITVTDNDGDTDMLSFDWTVEAEPTCVYPENPVGPYTWIQGTAITAFTVPASSCGTPPFTYSATGLPTGVSMSAEREVAGTPATTGSGTATVTVTDSNSDTDTLTFEWTVEAEPEERGTIDNPHILPNPLQVSALDIFSLIRGTGGGNNAASATYFRFTVPEGRAGEWTVAMDGSPNSRADWDLRGDSGLRATSYNADESDEVTLTAGQVYNFRIYPYISSARSRLTGLTLTLSPPASANPVFPVDPLDARTWIDGIAITAFTVDEATGGAAPLTYSAMGLPAGVPMDETTRVVSGTPTATGSGTATVTATDSNNATATVTLAWTVEEDTEPMFAVETLDARTWTQDTPIAAFTVDAATGGNAPLTYTASDLPAGVTMSADREVAGTPTATGTVTAAVTVTDRDADTDTVTFHWTVSTCEYTEVPVGPYTWIEGIGITAFTVPESTCGTAPLIYSATGLPLGVTMSADRQVAGTPSSAGSGTATVTVTDSNNDTVTLMFAWTVEADTEPMFPSPGPSDKSWTQNAAIAAFTVDAATAGNAPLSYAATGLPAGVAMNETTRVVSGTPTATGMGTATVTVTDRDGDSDSLTFQWSVPIIESGGTGTYSDPHILSNPLQVAALDIFSRLRGTGSGNSASAATYFRFTVPEDRAAAWTVAIDGSPNSGADWDLKGDDRLSSITTNADENDQVTLTAGQVYNFWVYPYQNDDRSALTGLTLTLTAPASTGPVFPVDMLDARTWVNGSAVTAFTVPEATGGASPLSHAATGLPVDVTMSADRAVSGTPTANGTGTATVTVTDSNDATDTLTFAWTVEADTEPVFSTTPPAQTWSQDRAIAAFTAPAATGGNAPLSYSIAGQPAGVTMSADREVAGTATAAGTGTATVTVTDNDGDTAMTTFAWTVEANTEPMFPTPVAAQTWTQDEAISAFTIAAATGGNGTLTYSVSGLHADVELNSQTLEVSGTPTTAGMGSATVTVTDRDGDSDTLMFDWTVSAPHTGQLTASPNPSTDGSYTVSHGSPPSLPADVLTPSLEKTHYYNLVETPAVGDPHSYYLARGPVSQAFTGKLTGTYRYQLQTCVFTVQQTEFDAIDTTVCTDAGTSLSVTVTPPPVPGAITGPGTNINGIYTLSWGSSTGATRYQLQERKNGGRWSSVSRTDSSTNAHAFTGKRNGIYDYRVSACKISACSAWSAVKTVTVSIPPTAGFDESYIIRTGDLDMDEDTDIYLSPLSIGSGNVGEFILENRSGTIVLDDTPDTTDLAEAQGWSESTTLELRVEDINLDGVTDAYVKGITGSITNAVDQFVISSTTSGAVPASIIAVDSELRGFFSAVLPWYRDLSHYDTPVAVVTHVIHGATDVQTAYASKLQACIDKWGQCGIYDGTLTSYYGTLSACIVALASQGFTAMENGRPVSRAQACAFSWRAFFGVVQPGVTITDFSSVPAEAADFMAIWKKGSDTYDVEDLADVLESESVLGITIGGFDFSGEENDDLDESDEQRIFEVHQALLNIWAILGDRGHDRTSDTVYVTRRRVGGLGWLPYSQNWHVALEYAFPTFIGHNPTIAAYNEGGINDGLLVSKRNNIRERNNDIDGTVTSPLYPTAALLWPALVASDWNYCDTLEYAHPFQEHQPYGRYEYNSNGYVAGIVSSVSGTTNAQIDTYFLGWRPVPVVEFLRSPCLQ